MKVLSEDQQIKFDPRIQPYIEQMEWIFFNSWVIMFGTVFFFKMFETSLCFIGLMVLESEISPKFRWEDALAVGVWSHFGCNL